MSTLLETKASRKTCFFRFGWNFVFSSDHELLNRYQYLGKIISIDDVISIKTDDGEIKTLPPDLKSLKKLNGIYTLKSCNMKKFLQIFFKNLLFPKACDKIYLPNIEVDIFRCKQLPF